MNDWINELIRNKIDNQENNLIIIYQHHFQMVLGELMNIKW